MTSSNNNNNVKMGKWHALAALDIIIGVIALILNIATVITLMNDWVDWIGIGIWGGSFFISAGSLTIKRSRRLKRLSILSVTTAVILIIIYGYSFGTHDQAYYCTIYSFQFDANGHLHYSLTYPYLCDWRLVADITFVVLGCLALITNVILSVKAKRIVKLTVTDHNLVEDNTQPTAPTLPQAVHQVTVNNHPQQQPEVNYRMQPGNPTSQPVYPTSQPGNPTSRPGNSTSQPGYPSNQPGYGLYGYPIGQPGFPTALPGQPTAPPGYPSTQQQQPFNYTQENPPSYEELSFA